MRAAVAYACVHESNSYFGGPVFFVAFTKLVEGTVRTPSCSLLSLESHTNKCCFGYWHGFQT